MRARRTDRFRAGALLRSGAVAASIVVALSFVGTAFGWRDISIAPSGFIPTLVTEDGQQDLHWTNETPQGTPKVLSNEGLFDSGPVPPGGGFSMKLQVPGHHPYHSDISTVHNGAIDVTMQGLPGDVSDPAADHIPDLAFPPAADGNVQVDARWGVPASTTRIMVGFKPGTTVGQANTILGAAYATIVGGMPDVGIVLVEVPPSFGADPFLNLKSDLTTLRADPSVDFAAMSLAAAP